MIILYHNHYGITQAISSAGHTISHEVNQNITHGILRLASQYPDEILVWCHESLAESLNIGQIESLFHHHRFLFSYQPKGQYLGRELGYIEDSPYVQVNKTVRYATWQMSSVVGAVHASVLNVRLCKPESNFDYFLNSLAKRAMPQGIFCYSEPQLLSAASISQPTPQATLFQIFRFTKQHYKTRWVFLLFFNLILFEKRWAILPLLRCLCYQKRRVSGNPWESVSSTSVKNIVSSGTIDVLIPTMGRKNFLRNVLSNLAAQTLLPINVIIIEQNPEPDSISDLNFIQKESWPFTIKHQFTHQSGACNARNMGLALLESEFCFMADDDIVFENDLLAQALHYFTTTGNEVFLVACHLPNQKVETQAPKQFPVFGAGHAFVKSSCVRDIRFRMGYEFGFGEDNDFGMQLRHKGYDILYISTSKILHLKAPIGGFRTQPVLRWQQHKVLPKPSPTLMLFRLLYDTKEQLRGYKTTLFFKNITKRFFINPIHYIKTFNQKWNASVYWAQQLKKE
ncbi:glycosyltransferase family 2 protein [Flavobacterium sp.]|uniref:glycosyltransferase family 2 protein n=1 Tax=Flavobacterium sp. TaxID=239 RepID=UPI002FDDE001